MSTAGSEATSGTPATPAAAPPPAAAAPTETPPAAPTRNKGGRPSNASKAAAAAAAASIPAAVLAAKADAPAAPKAPEVAAPPPAPAAKPEDTVGGRKAAEAAEEAAKAAAEAIAAAPKAKTLDQVKAERRAKAAAESAKGTGAAATTDAATDEAAAAAKAAAQATGGEKTDEQKSAELAAKEAEDAEKTKAAANKKKPETVETDIPAEKLKEFTKLNRDLRDATTENRKLKADVVPLAESLKKAADLAKEGKHYDAIRALKAHGIDFDKAAAEVLRVQAEDADLDPETKKLRDELAAANDRLAKLENGQTQAEKDAESLKAAAEKAQKEKGVEQVVAEVTLATERFPYLSKSPEFVREALEGADDAYPLAVKHLGRPLTDDEKNNLLRAALEEAEDRHAARAKLYGVKPKKAKEEPVAAATAGTGAAATTPTTTDAGMRGGVAAITPPHRKRTLAEIKAERRASGRR